MPTPNVCSDIWDCVESYAICMLLARRLKIISTSYLKLIISFLVLLILVLSFFKLLLVVALMQHAYLTLRTVHRWPTGLVHNFKILLNMNDLQAAGTISTFSQAKEKC